MSGRWVQAHDRCDILKGNREAVQLQSGQEKTDGEWKETFILSAVKSGQGTGQDKEKPFFIKNIESNYSMKHRCITEK